jgi:dihydroneopterin aldolase
LIDEATSTAVTTTIHYMDGTTTTLTHAADTAFSVLLALQNAMANALQSDWKKVTHDVTLSVAVSGIANA